MPERFDRYMERCLYGPDGFYTAHGAAGGRGGDFITSPSVGPLFGAVVAEAIDGWWHELGRPDPFRVFDVGCGPGTLLRAVALARPDRPWDLTGVDRSGSGDTTDMPDDLTGAVVVANELLDNLPFRVIEGGPARREVFVTVDGDIAREELGPTDVDLQLADGIRAPLIEQATAWVAGVLDRGAARVLVFDYGARTTAELAERGGWLRTYRQHERGADPLVEPGRWDITTDVPWDQLPAGAMLDTQRDFLLNHGVDRLVDEGRDHWRRHAHAPDITALRMRSRVTERGALLDPDGLGGWLVGVWSQ